MPLLSSPSVRKEIRNAEYQTALTAGDKHGADGPRHWLKATLITGFTLITLGIAAYGPAAALEYGRADDYWLLLNNATYAPEVSERVWIEAGRFLPALASTWLFPYVDSVPELFQMRLVAIAALASAGVALSLMTLRLLAQPFSPVQIAVAQLVGLAALVTPAAPSAATWGVMAVQLWALPLAVASGLVATTERLVLGIRWEVLAGVLLVLSTFTYQPAAAASLLPVFMWSALRWARRQPPYWRRPIMVMALLFVSLACNVSIVRFFHWAGNDRLGGHGVGESLVWFVGEYLPRTVAFAVPPSVNSLGLSLVALAAALMSPLTVGRRFVALPASVVCAWLIASILVVPGELWATYRLVMTPQTMLWCGSLACVAFAVREWHRAKPEAASSLVAVLAACGIALMGVSGYRAYAYLAKPNAVDWASVQCVVRQSPPLTNRSVLIVNPFSASASSVRAYDEYGITASSTVWALPDIVWLAAKQVDADHLPPQVDARRLTVVERSSATSTDADAMLFEQNICGALTQSRG